ncbi:aminoglycoside phosphotransferase family protein [Mesorhizobium sp. M0047]|uniref:phosphotransferase family protein n=1 Tax=Mesorhizobium sp. M0047 TaxID=2956859 RepID=UPI003338F5A1
MPEPNLDTFSRAIIRAFPELETSSFRLMTAGWHSTAVDVDDRLVFKFPRHKVAERALLSEAALLALIRPCLSMPVPAMSIHEGPPLFSRHEKLKGDHLLAARYEELPEHARQRLGNDLGRFYAELHRLDLNQMATAGAEPVGTWQAPSAIRAKALPLLAPRLLARAEATLMEYESLPPDPHGIIYGFFDGHGWNMAFDHARMRLNGLYDFADSGIGALHQEFIYSNFIAPDLTARIVAAYEIATGRVLDRQRISILTGVHRLSELAELVDDPDHVPAMIRSVAEWFAAPLQRMAISRVRGDRR